MLIIGIAGGSGSGKTTVVNRLRESLPATDVCVVSQDAYYKDASHLPMADRLKINYDHPNAIEFDLLVEHIKQLRSGSPIEMPKYSFVTCTRLDETETVVPHKVLIVEGIFVLAIKELRDLVDIAVYVDADADDRLSRRILRDMTERGRTAESVISDYNNKVKPMHLEFIEPSKRNADIIVPQGGHNDRAIDVLRQYVHSTINSSH
ncbi:MAG: uridine kinase [Bacteroidales bacterium]|nr:uridine kinase [Bacteroidales bacterium]